MTVGLLAPAKVNLFLHVGAPDAQGYHPLVSLMVFADVGDTVALAPADAVSLRIDGPFAGAIAGEADNLVTRAARRLLARAGRGDGCAITLTKALPVAAGLGGGSSDAGATLKLLRQVLDLPLSDDDLEAVAADIGADGPACLWARPVMAQGRGERLSPGPAWPDLPCVLVNPGAPSPTGLVFRAYDAGGAFSDVTPPPLDDLDDVAAVVERLKPLRNDLEAPAIVLEPRIREVLDALSAAPEALLTRMSGSGATCFALCADDASAQAVADRIAEARPAWWVTPCRLKGA